MQGRRATLTSVDFVEDLSNLREIVMCDDYLPLDYPYLMKNAKGGGFHATGAGLLKIYGKTPENCEVTDTLGFCIWTTAKWTTITGFSFAGDKIRVHVAAGEILDMRNLRDRVLAQKAPFKSASVPKEKRTAETDSDISFRTGFVFSCLLEHLVKSSRGKIRNIYFTAE